MKTSNKAQQYLNEFRTAFDPCFDKYLAEKTEQLTRIDPVMGKILAEKIRDFSAAGGKRIRAALVALGYRAAGGDDERDVLPAAISVELLHSFFLIHDDLIDKSEMRRAGPTVHKMFETDYYQLLKNPTERQHLSYSMALLTGDLCCAMVYEALTSLNLPADRVARAIEKMQQVVTTTVLGQGLDVVRPLEENVSEQAVEQIYLFKTARYTIEGPLHLGLILAKAPDQLFEEISCYAVPVGIAFQVEDDVLGVFGAEEELGKPITSDIKEGKQTILVVATQRLGTKSQRERLKCFLGNPNITLADIKEAQEIMRQSGALAYTRDYARRLVAEGKAKLSQISISAEIKEILEDLADYIIERTF